MKPTDLEAAIELIDAFREGVFHVNDAISDRQMQLLKLLREDLLPREPELDDDLVSLAPKLAQEDTRWNHAAMEALNAIYSLRSSGREQEASAAQQRFLRSCPSAWYRDVVEAA